MKTRDLHVESNRPLLPPAILLEELPLGEDGSQVVSRAREEIIRILAGEDDRLFVVVGPCSVHDPAAALDYARRLRTQAAELQADLRVVMRVYFRRDGKLASEPVLIEASASREASSASVSGITKRLAGGCDKPRSS